MMRRKIWAIVWLIIVPGLLTGCSKESDEMITCEISINCETLLSNMDKLKESKRDYVPEDGWVLEPVSREIPEGSSAYDLVSEVCREYGIQMEFSESPLYRTAYIEGIHQLYELDCGSTSGWMYRVNGEFPNYGCSQYELKDQDVVEFLYTCNLGLDVGKEIE